MMNTLTCRWWLIYPSSVVAFEHMVQSSAALLAADWQVVCASMRKEAEKNDIRM